VVCLARLYVEEAMKRAMRETCFAVHADLEKSAAFRTITSTTSLDSLVRRSLYWATKGNRSVTRSRRDQTHQGPPSRHHAKRAREAVLVRRYNADHSCNKTQ